MFSLAFFFTSWRITVQLKFNIIYGPTSMKERCGAPLLGLAKSIYYIYARVVISCGIDQLLLYVNLLITSVQRILLIVV